MKRETFEQKKRRILKTMRQKEMLSEILILCQEAKEILNAKNIKL